MLIAFILTLIIYAGVGFVNKCELNPTKWGKDSREIAGIAWAALMLMTVFGHVMAGVVR